MYLCTYIHVLTPQVLCVWKYEEFTVAEKNFSSQLFSNYFRKAVIFTKFSQKILLHFFFEVQKFRENRECIPDSALLFCHKTLLYDFMIFACLLIYICEEFGTILRLHIWYNEFTEHLDVLSNSHFGQESWRRGQVYKSKSWKYYNFCEFL